jgi:hypothetical protein
VSKLPRKGVKGRGGAKTHFVPRALGPMGSKSTPSCRRNFILSFGLEDNGESTHAWGSQHTHTHRG